MPASPKTQRIVPTGLREPRSTQTHASSGGPELNGLVFQTVSILPSRTYVEAAELTDAPLRTSGHAPSGASVGVAVGTGSPPPSQTTGSACSSGSSENPSAELCAFALSSSQARTAAGLAPGFTARK